MYHVNPIIEKPESWDGKLAIILAHGAGQGMHSPFMCFFHEGLAAFGALSVKFNFDYIERGKKVPDRMPSLQDQYRSVIDAVIAGHDPQTLIIGGKSMEAAWRRTCNIRASTGWCFWATRCIRRGSRTSCATSTSTAFITPCCFYPGRGITLRGATCSKPLSEGLAGTRRCAGSKMGIIRCRYGGRANNPGRKS
jgi:hypothetical protein